MPFPPIFSMMRSNLVVLGQNFRTSTSLCYSLDPRLHAPDLPPCYATRPRCPKQPDMRSRPELPCSPPSHAPSYRAPVGVSPFVFLPCLHTVRSAYVKQPGSSYNQNFNTPSKNHPIPHTLTPPGQYSHQLPPAASCPQPDGGPTTRFSIRWAHREGRQSHRSTLPICDAYARHSYPSTPVAPPRCQLRRSTIPTRTTRRGYR